MKSDILSQSKKKLLLDNGYCLIERSIENSPKAISSSDLAPHSFKNNFKSISFRFLRKIIHTFIFFLPLHSKLYYHFNVWPNLKLRHLFNLKT